MSEEFKKLIVERWHEIPAEVQAYMSKDDFPRKMELVAKKYHLDPEQERHFQNNVIFVLLTLDSLDNLYHHFVEDLNLSPENAENLANDTKEYICGGVSSYLAHNESDLIIKDNEPPTTLKVNPEAPTSSLLRQSVSSPTFQSVKISSSEVQPHKPQLDQTPTKASLLSEIENPHRTVIKKYVIEHEPITDPEHIIDDTIDMRPRLEQ
jgi:hypothetical protein